MSTGAVVKDLGKIIQHEAVELTPVTKRFIAEKIAPMETAFKSSKAGNSLLERFNFYRQEADKKVSEFTQAAGKGIPVSANGKALVVPHEIRQEAHNQARAKAFGAKDEGIQFLLNAAKKEKGDLHAQVLSDHMGVMFKDTAYQDGKHIGQANKLSRNLNKTASGLTEEESKNVFKPANPAPYKGVGKGENRLRSYMAKTLAVGAAIPHSVSSINTLMAEGLVNYTKAVTKAIPLVNYEDTRLFLKSTNAIAEMSSIEYNQHFAYQNSIFKKAVDNFKFIPGSVGEFVHSNFSMPGMSGIRKWNLTVAAMASKFSAEEMSARVMQGNDTIAEQELRRFKLDPNEIKKQGGHLTKEQLQTAIFHGTDYSAFIENPSKRTQFSQASMIGRTMFAMHGFVGRQAKFIKDDLMKAYVQKDFVGLGKKIALLGLIAPEVGNGIQLLENIRHGKGIQESKDEWATNEKGMHIGSSSDFVSYISHNIEAISHIGALGVITGYTRSLARNKLLEALAGPLANKGDEFIEDAYKYAMVDSAHPRAGDAFKRDVLSDIPSAGLGGYLSHKIYPTTKEINARKIKSAKAQKSAETRARKKKPSNNPLRRMFN